MTPEQRSFFRENGYLFVRGALTKGQVRPIKKHILEELNRMKIWSSGKTLSNRIKKIPPFQQIATLSGLITWHGLPSKVMTQDTLFAVNSLIEGELAPPQSQLLISLPNQGGWTLAGLNWHTDIASSRSRGIPGVQVFALIDDIKDHGGATLALAGSHLLESRGEKVKIREILRKGDDVENELRSSNLSIVEMSGYAGDVYLMDMRLLHTPSINSTKNVRMVAALRYLLR